MTGTSLPSSFSGDSLFQSVKDQFKNFPEHRDTSRIEILLEDFLMSAMAIFVLKFPSLLQFEEEIKKERNFTNLKGLFGITRVPSDTHMRSVVDQIPTESFRPIFKNLFQKVQRAKLLEDFQIFYNTYCLAIDGTGYFFSDSVHCENCLEKKHKSQDECQYYHHMLCGAIVHPNKSNVIPIMPEPISWQDGNTKNDCEQNAVKRMLKKFREDHPKLKTIILADALHATVPLLELLKKLDLGFVIAVKPGSHESLFAGVDKREETSSTQHFEEEEEIGDKIKKKRIRHYRFTNGILLNQKSAEVTVNFLEFWETIQWADKKGRLKEEKRHFSWVTDYSLYSSSCKQITEAGRTRWKIENETFNTLKNQGYEFEHNFGHGYKNLSNNFAMVMLLAFLIDQLQEMKCDKFKSALFKVFDKKSRLWVKLKTVYEFFPTEFKSWNEFLDFFIDPKPWFKRPNSS
jgi:hypothetical protein